MVYKVYSKLVMKGVYFKFYKNDNKDVFSFNDIKITVDENDIIEMNGSVVSLQEVDLI